MEDRIHPVLNLSCAQNTPRMEWERDKTSFKPQVCKKVSSTHHE